MLDWNPQETSREYSAVPHVYDKDIRDIKVGIRLQVTFDPTLVIVIAIHRDPSKNAKVKIACDKCLPMHGYSYSAVSDTCSIRCFGHYSLGMIEVSYKACMRGTGGCESRIALPPTVIRRYLTFDQRRMLKSFEGKYKDYPDIDIEFVQMPSAY